jgi:signal transduction histidine kinase
MPEVHAKVQEARESVREAIERLRTMLFELHPPSLDRDGLVAALEEYAHDLFADRDVTVDVQAAVEIEPSPAVRSVVFRVAREAIANTHKHAGATRLTMRARDAHGGVEVRITDDGCGFSTARTTDRLHRGTGVAAELARTAGGWWSIDSAPGEGTTVEFWLPDAVVIDVTRDRQAEGADRATPAAPTVALPA